MKTIIVILSCLILFWSISTSAQTASKIYYSDYGGFNFNVYKSNLDGSNHEVLTMPIRPNGVAVDWRSDPQKLYVGLTPTSGPGKIIKCNTDGSSIEDVITDLIKVDDIELDLINRKIYWAQDTYSDDRIYKANMDGTNSEIQQIYSSTTSNSNLWGLALDVNTQQLWFTLRGSNCYASYIKKISTNGGAASNILYPICNPHDIEYYNGSIYWADADGIKSSNPDGSNIDTIILGAKVYGLSIDATNNRIYWTDYNYHGVKYINIDGSNEMYISALGTLNYIDTDYNPSATEVNESSTDQFIFYLGQNFPNPFNPSTKISWQSPAGSWQTLKVFDILGNEISTLVDEYKPAGRYEVEFNLDQSAYGGSRPELASGIYFYQLQVVDPKTGNGKGIVQTRKMILLK